MQYELRYEPWVMCDRRNVPWHDHLFKGYGLNKIVHLEHMNSTGYRWEEREGMALNEGKRAQASLSMQWHDEKEESDKQWNLGNLFF